MLAHHPPVNAYSCLKPLDAHKSLLEPSYNSKNHFTPIHASTLIDPPPAVLQFLMANVRTDSCMNSFFPRIVIEWNAQSHTLLNQYHLV